MPVPVHPSRCPVQVNARERRSARRGLVRRGAASGGPIVAEASPSEEDQDLPRAGGDQCVGRGELNRLDDVGLIDVKNHNLPFFLERQDEISSPAADGHIADLTIEPPLERSTGRIGRQASGRNFDVGLADRLTTPLRNAVAVENATEREPTVIERHMTGFRHRCRPRRDPDALYRADWGGDAVRNFKLGAACGPWPALSSLSWPPPGRRPSVPRRQKFAVEKEIPDRIQVNGGCLLAGLYVDRCQPQSAHCRRSQRAANVPPAVSGANPARACSTRPGHLGRSLRS